MEVNKGSAYFASGFRAVREEEGLVVMLKLNYTSTDVQLCSIIFIKWYLSIQPIMIHPLPTQTLMGQK